MKEILNKIDKLIDGRERDLILKDICVLLNREIKHYNWVGFYTMGDDSKLHLGPYVGDSTDHTVIEVGVGVCGQVAERNETMVVQDVRKEANYLSCSINVRSEIVVPVSKDGKFISQIDIDSHMEAPFTEYDTDLLTQIAEKISKLF